MNFTNICRPQLNPIAIRLLKLENSKHRYTCPHRYFAYAKLLTGNKRPMRPHPIIPSSCARRGEGAAEQPQRINIIVDTTPYSVHENTVYTPNRVYSVHVNTTPTRVHENTVYTPNRVYSVHVNTTPHSVHGDTNRTSVQSKRPMRPHPIIPSHCKRRGEGAAEQPQRINIIVDTTPTRVHENTVYTPNRVYSVHVNTTPYSVHENTVYTPNRVYSVHVNTTPYSVHGDTTPTRVQSKRPMRPHPIIPSPCARRGEGAAEQPQRINIIVDTTPTRVHGDDGYCDSIAPKVRHGLVEMVPGQERPASDEAKQPQKIGNIADTIRTRVQREKSMRPHPIIPSPCARRGESAAEQPQRINIIVDTTPTRVHEDDGYCDSIAPKVRHGLVEMV